jgi:F-type H+-transporting ATPase subunit gamma
MKAMAAVGIRQYERAVESLGDYRRTIELGLQALLHSQPDRLVTAGPAPAEQTGAIVFGSDQGMCGRFNSQIAEHTIEAIGAYRREGKALRMLVIGGRIVPLLEMAGLSVDEQAAPATSLFGITSLVQEVLVKIEQWRSQRTVDEIVLLYNRSLGGAAYEPHTQKLFPVDLEWLDDLRGRKWPSRGLPIHTMEWSALFASLIREFFHTALFQAAAESLASENASRLVSMQAAERNIEERLEELNMHFRLLRQQTITEEILDITSGFEALSTQKD